jgi:hypothetical protein
MYERILQGPAPTRLVGTNRRNLQSRADAGRRPPIMRQIDGTHDAGGQLFRWSGRKNSD